MADAFGREEDVPSPPPPRETLESEAVTCWGLPPERPFDGTATALLRVVPVSVFVGLATLWLDRLVMPGAADCNAATRTLPVGLPKGGVPLGDAGGQMPSSIVLISGGMGRWCTTLTAGQSAAPMYLYSVEVGGRQQPGQPGFWYPERVSGGLVFAHCQGNT